VRHGEGGQGSAEYAGLLAVVALVVAAVTAGGMGGAIADGAERAICAIVGDGCAQVERGRPQVQRLAGDPAAPPLAGGEIAALPFPGSVSVTCGYGEGSEKACQGGEGTGVRVKAEGEVSVERSETSLGGDGCPQQTLSVGTTLQLAQEAEREGKRVKGSGTFGRHLGKRTSYSATVSPDQADAIAEGRREPPNPLDPRTIARPGESVQMSEEHYLGLGLSREYAKLQASLGYERGRRVSSGVQRKDRDTMTVMIGDEDVVRSALAFGAGGIEVGFGRELAEGRLKTIDIDVSSREGWDAYQRFVATGQLPSGGPGTSEPRTARTLKASQSATLSATFGDVKIGGLLSDAEGSYTATKDAQGGTSHDLSIRYRDLGLQFGVDEDAQGNEGERRYALNLEGVDPDVYANFQALNFGDTRASAGGHMRMEFSGDDLRGIRRQALEQVAFEMERRGARPRPTPEQVAENLERNHGVIKYGGATYAPEGVEGALAGAETPEDVLSALYRLGNGDPDRLLSGPLTEFILNTNQARGDANPTAGAKLPGRVVAPHCGR
jgi:hypothetical protein